MSTDSTLTSKGQTTIPKDIRDTLGHEIRRPDDFYHAAGWHRSYARQEQERDEPCGKPAKKRTEARSG